MEIRHFRRFQREYGEKLCPECEGTLTLYMEHGRLYECCHYVNCGFVEEIEEDEI